MNIKCTQNIYKSANGVSNVTYYILVPEGVEVRGIVQLSHGMCEYFSRYTAFAKYLCGLGFIVCGNDHIGHGASVSRTADLGFFAARDGWKYLVEDVKHLTDLMQRRYPDLPYFLLGHSMGSLIATAVPARLRREAVRLHPHRHGRPDRCLRQHRTSCGFGSALARHHLSQRTAVQSGVQGLQQENQAAENRV